MGRTEVGGVGGRQAREMQPEHGQSEGPQAGGQVGSVHEEAGIGNQQGRAQELSGGENDLELGETGRGQDGTELQGKLFLESAAVERVRLEQKDNRSSGGR